jgi:hypothetical protein
MMDPSRPRSFLLLDARLADGAVVGGLGVLGCRNVLDRSRFDRIQLRSDCLNVEKPTPTESPFRSILAKSFCEYKRNY